MATNTKGKQSSASSKNTKSESKGNIKSASSKKSADKKPAKKGDTMAENVERNDNTDQE